MVFKWFSSHLSYSLFFSLHACWHLRSFSRILCDSTMRVVKMTYLSWKLLFWMERACENLLKYWYPFQDGLAFFLQLARIFHLDWSLEICHKLVSWFNKYVSIICHLEFVTSWSLLSRCLMVSTNQADPGCFYFRISWILMERRWFYFFT